MEEYTGYRIWIPTEEELVEFYQEKKIPENFKLLENEYLLIEDAAGELIDKYCFRKGKLEQILYCTLGSQATYGLFKPRNPEQYAAFDLVKEDNTTIKLITGGYGCGKTMALVVGALDKISKGKFDKIVWVRNNINVKDTAELGALPGDAFDKLLPFVLPLADHVGGIDGIKMLIDQGQLEVTHLGHIRGRNIKNAIILCSEAENLTKEHIQLLIGRVGENSNLWLDADLKQRDKQIFEKSAGIERMVERLRGNKFFGYVKLRKTERSETAQLADLLD